MRKFLYHIPAGIISCAVTVIIAWLSLAKDPLPTSQIPLFEGADKIVHFLMYLGCTVAYLLDYAKLKLPHHTLLKIELALTSVAILLGLLMEVAQLAWLVQGRDFDLIDWFADAVGAMTGFALMRFWFMHTFRHNYFKTVKRHRRHR